MAIHAGSLHARPGLPRLIGGLFAIGSLCFLLGPFPGFVQLVGSAADGMVFFVGSIFFTSAALLQALEARDQDRLPTLIQFAGTIMFNVDTFRAMKVALDNPDVNRLVWAPEAVGSACFLISGWMAYRAVRGWRRSSADGERLEWRIAAVNLLGCVLFGISTIGGYAVPDEGDVLSLAAANFGTAAGALCFLIGAVWLARSSSPAG